MRAFVLLACLLLAGCRQSAAQDAVLPRVDQIDGDRVYTLLPPDAIPAIDQPRFVPASAAAFMRDDEPVVGVVEGGVAKAYSTWHLDRHEIVNDSVAGKPVAVTW